eukprot:5326005-Amphidinium_carterae.1
MVRSILHVLPPQASFGGFWPEFGAYPATEVADRGCAVLEDFCKLCQHSPCSFKYWSTREYFVRYRDDASILVLVFAYV